MTPWSVPVRLLDAHDLEHVLGGQRLEIEPVGGVVVGRDGLRVAVDHDRLVAGVGEREAGVAAAIVELDALADAVRPAAEDDHLLAVARLGLVGERAGEGHLVGRVHVGGRRGELGGAGVDALEDRVDAERARGAPRPRPRSLPASAASRASEKPCAFSRRSGPAVVRQAVLADFGFRFDDRLHLPEEPRVDLADGVDLLDRQAEPQRLRAARAAGPASAGRARRGWRSCRRPGRGRGSSTSSRPVSPVSSPRSAFCSDSAKVRPIAITSPTDFIEVVSSRLGAGEFLEGEARDLGDDVVDGRLEARPASRRR